MSEMELDAFRQMVFQEPGLQSALVDILDESAFIAAVCALAQSRGLQVTGQDVRDAMLASRRTWIERWIT